MRCGIPEPTSEVHPDAHCGWATFLNSIKPVLGSINSFQLTGTIVFPASLTAEITPSSFLVVDR
jgi:hypothetical protein